MKTSKGKAKSNRSQLKIGVVTARFNSDVTGLLQHGALKCLRESGVLEKNIWVVSVPGAFEVPLACQALFKKGAHGVVALAAVIRGETSHYDYVCNAVERGCSELQLKFHKPIGFGVLTTDNEEQAMDRCGGNHGHKGEEAAQVTLEMVELLKKV